MVLLISIVKALPCYLLLLSSASNAGGCFSWKSKYSVTKAVSSVVEAARNKEFFNSIVSFSAAEQHRKGKATLQAGANRDTKANHPDP
jgi:hypothetical protein